MKRTLLVLVLAVAWGSVGAQHISVPAEVTSVSTAGRWQSGRIAGSYRVVVVRDGWEHIWSRVYVEWLQDPADRDSLEPKPLSIRELIPPGVAQGTAVLEAKALL